MGERKEKQPFFAVFTSIVESEMGIIAVLISITVMFRVMIHGRELLQDPLLLESWYRIAALGVTLPVMALSVCSYSYAKSMEEARREQKKVAIPANMIFVFAISLVLVILQMFFFRPGLFRPVNIVSVTFWEFVRIWIFGVVIPDIVGFLLILFVFGQAKLPGWVIPKENEKDI